MLEAVTPVGLADRGEHHLMLCILVLIVNIELGATGFDLESLEQLVVPKTSRGNTVRTPK